MSDNSSDEFSAALELEEDYEYALIRFKHKGRRRKIEDIDLVPTNWMTINEKESLQCKFLDSMEEEEDKQMLHDLVKRNGPAPEIWPLYPVQAVGRAHTYEEGLVKLDKLRTTENVFTDSEAGDSQAEKALIRQIKRKKLQAEADNLKRKFKASRDDDSTGSIKSPQRKRPVKENGEFLELSTKSRNEIQKATNNSSNTYLESDTILRESAQNDQQFQIINSYSSSTDTDASQPPLFGHDDRDTTDKENTPKISTGDAINVSELALPVLDLSGVVCQNDFEKAVMCILTKMIEKMGVLETEMKGITKRQKELKSSLNEFKSTKRSAGDNFSDKHGFDLPIKNMETFTTFNQDLMTKEQLKKDLYAEFKSCLDEECSITKTIGSIFRKFVSKEVLLRFTAVKGSSSTPQEAKDVDKDKFEDKEDKDSFEPLHFCQCMYSFIRINRKKKLSKECSDADLRKALRQVFSNIKKWKSV